MKITAVFIFAMSFFMAQTTLKASEKSSGNEMEELVQLRGRLLQAFMKESTTAVIQKTDSAVTQFAQSEYFPLYPIEEWLLYYQTSQWQKLIASVEAYNEEYIKRLSDKQKPAKDELFQTIQKNSLQNSETIFKQIDTSTLVAEDKQFLHLHFSSCLMGLKSKNIEQDSLNAQTNRFLQTWSNSRWQWYARNYIRNEFVAGNWGVDVDAFGGAGSARVMGDERFNNLITYGFGISVYYKLFMLQLRDYIGQSSLKKEIAMPYTTWERGSYVSFYKLEAALGAVALETKHWRIIPLVGVSTFDIVPTTDEIARNPNYKSVEYSFFPVYTLGANIEWKFARNPQTAPAGFEQGYWFLRLHAAYEAYKFDQTNELNAYMFTLSMGGFARKVKRRID